MSRAAYNTSWSDAIKMLAIIALWLAAAAWMRPLMHPDEGRYATVAYEMLRSGDWLTPTLNGMPFFHKPPLFYWLTGAALAVFGPNEFAARMASLIGASMGAWALYLFTRHWCGQALARRSVLVLLVLPMFFAAAQFANLDMLVAGCITATILALAHAALCFEQGLAYRRVLWLAYVLAGLGVLAKGLIGFVLPAMVIGLWLLLRWRWRTLWALLSVPGVVLMLVVTHRGLWRCNCGLMGFCITFSWCSISSGLQRPASTMCSHGGSTRRCWCCVVFRWCYGCAAHVCAVISPIKTPKVRYAC